MEKSELPWMKVQVQCPLVYMLLQNKLFLQPDEIYSIYEYMPTLLQKIR